MPFGGCTVLFCTYTYPYPYTYHLEFHALSELPAYVAASVIMHVVVFLNLFFWVLCSFSCVTNQ